MVRRTRHTFINKINCLRVSRRFVYNDEGRRGSVFEQEQVCNLKKILLRFATDLNHNLFVAIVNTQYLNIENTG
jgi:hypothetical protein